VLLGAAFQPAIGDDTLVASGTGQAARVDLVLGEDTDGDGLPDAWENMVIANSGGAAQNLADVGPGLDLDQDGMTDDEEFWYGSFAFLPGDELRFHLFAKVGERFAISLLTVPGARYIIEKASNLNQPNWTICPISLTEVGPTSPSEFVGDGTFQDVYFEAAVVDVRFRLQTL
jgi:hypothetical protein